MASPYTIESFGIVDPETFWDFIRANDGEVVSVTFEAAAPNMFGGRDDFRRELRELRDKEKTEKTKVEIHNENGLNPDTERHAPGGRLHDQGRRWRDQGQNETRKPTILATKQSAYAFRSHRSQRV